MMIVEFFPDGRSKVTEKQIEQGFQVVKLSNDRFLLIHYTVDGNDYEELSETELNERLAQLYGMRVSGA
jgi:hypothetical protein